jgi:ABC-2 type transport system permease protein
VDVDRVPMVVWDQSGSDASAELVSRFLGSRYFSLAEYVQGYGEVEKAIDARTALAALIVPADFAHRVGSGRKARVQLLLDGTDSNTATIAQGYAEAAVRAYSQDVAMEKFRRAGGREVRPPLEVRPRVWFNADLESRNYIIPGLVAVIMMVIAALLTSLTVAREWERGTMEQLISTPVKGPELVLGKLVPYFVIGMLDVLLAVLMGQFLFRVPLRGNVWLVFGMGAVFLAGALAMGMLISIASKSQLLASQIAMTTTFLPAFLLSGFQIPVANMPRPIQLLTYLVPARYFVELLHGIYLKGVGLDVLALQACLLLAYTAAMLLAANMKFKKKL